MEVKHVLKNHAYLNIPLSFIEAFELGKFALESLDGDNLSQVQAITMLSALHTKATYSWRHDKHVEKVHGHRLPKNAAEQIAGVCAAVFEHDIKKSEFGFIAPNVPFVMDNCGMGGDLIVTANISTLSGFIAAAAGIPMCKHGSPANADKGLYGSSDFISLICGIDNYAHKDKVIECVENFGFGYTEACDTRYKRIHLQTHQIAMLPHMNDIIGPITNPIHPELMTRRVVGLNQLIPPRVLAEAYRILNKNGYTFLSHGLFIRGFVDSELVMGMDEISICAGGTQVAELKDGLIREYWIYASDFGVPEAMANDYAPIGNKGEYSLEILEGKHTGARLDVILVNAAILFYLGGKSDDLAACYQLAKEVFESGEPLRVKKNVKEFVPLVSQKKCRFLKKA